MKKELGLMSVLFCLTPALIAQNKVKKECT